MTATIRPLTENDLAEASALCLRSKAHWGYDVEFMNACRTELTLTAADLKGDLTVGAVHDDTILAVAQLCEAGGRWELEKLFVEPNAMGRGFGRLLIEWAIDTVAAHGGTRIEVASDPVAAPFYRSMGAEDAGQAASGSIPGRVLPRLILHVGR